MRLSRSVFWIVWLLVAAFAIWLYRGYRSPTNFVGIVEQFRHTVACDMAGKVVELNVGLGERVKNGQVLGRVQTADQGSQADQLRLESDLAGMRSDLRRELSQLSGIEAELSALNAEIARLKTAQADGMVRARDLSDLQIKRDGLAAEAAALRKLLSEQAPDDAVKQLSGEMQQFSEIVQQGTIISPCDGVVLKVIAFPGDTVDAFAPILEIEQDLSNHLEVYLPEQREPSVAVGSRVVVTSQRSDVKPAHGTVLFLDPGYRPLPQRLMIGQEQTWVRRALVELDPGHGLQPGERVKVRTLSSFEQ